MEKLSKLFLVLLMVKLRIAVGGLDICSLNTDGLVEKIGYQEFTGVSCTHKNLISEDKHTTEFQCYEKCYRAKECNRLYYNKVKMQCVLLRDHVDCFNRVNPKVYYGNFNRQRFRKQVSDAVNTTQAFSVRMWCVYAFY